MFIGLPRLGPSLLLPQETVLFNDTIMQNIRYGRPDATDDEVLEAARMARLDVAVSRMPNAFHTGTFHTGMQRAWRG